MASPIKKNKIQQAQMEKVVYELLIAGWNRKNIIDELINNYGYKNQNAQKIITKVMSGLVEIEKDNIEECKARYMNMYLDLYSKALNASEYRTSNEILKSIIKLQGLDVQKVEANINNNIEVIF